MGTVKGAMAACNGGHVESRGEATAKPHSAGDRSAINRDRLHNNNDNTEIRGRFVPDDKIGDVGRGSSCPLLGLLKLDRRRRRPPPPLVSVPL